MNIKRNITRAKDAWNSMSKAEQTELAIIIGGGVTVGAIASVFTAKAATAAGCGWIAKAVLSTLAFDLGVGVGGAGTALATHKYKSLKKSKLTSVK